MCLPCRCVAMLAHLYHSPAAEPCGAATVGCTEACLLSGLAAKKAWQARRREACQPIDRPNLVIGSNYQACLRSAASSERSLKSMGLPFRHVMPAWAGLRWQAYAACCCRGMPAAAGAWKQQSSREACPGAWKGFVI